MVRFWCHAESYFLPSLWHRLRFAGNWVLPAEKRGWLYEWRYKIRTFRKFGSKSLWILLLYCWFLWLSRCWSLWLLCWSLWLLCRSLLLLKIAYFFLKGPGYFPVLFFRTYIKNNLSAHGCVVKRLEMLTYFVYAPLSNRLTPCPEL